MSFFGELKRRNVIRMAGLYLVGAWLVVQVAGTVLPMFGAPEWLPRSIVVLLAIGFVPAAIFSWVFELTPEGLKREQDVAPQQSITPRTGRRIDRMINGPALCVLGLIDAALGRKDLGLDEGRRAIELLPVEKDAADSSEMLVYFAMIAAWASEKDTALQYLAANAQSPGGSNVATYGALKLLPFWDPLRGDPRFEKIVASLAPKEPASAAK